MLDISVNFAFTTTQYFFFFPEVYAFIEMAPFSLTCYFYTFQLGKKFVISISFSFLKKSSQTKLKLVSSSFPICLPPVFILFANLETHFMCLWLLHKAFFTTVVLKLTLEPFPIWFSLPIWEVSICGYSVLLKSSKHALIHLFNTTLECCPRLSWKYKHLEQTDFFFSRSEMIAKNCQ